MEDTIEIVTLVLLRREAYLRFYWKLERWLGQAPRRRHPIERHGVCPRTIVAITSTRTSFLRKYVSPVYLDVCIRVWWRVLPVGYMCWGGDVDRRLCTYGCSVLETYDHCFFSCSVSSSLWQLHYSGWKRILSRRPQWTDVLFGLDLPVSSSHARGPQFLWNVLCCIVMYVLWLTRNDRKHRDVVAPPVHALHARTTTLSRARCHAILPDIEHDDLELHEELQPVLLTLQLVFEDKEGLRVDNLPDVILTFVLGARGTSATTLTWIFLMLAKHPYVERKIRNELAALELDDGAYVTGDDAQNLVYLEAAVREVLRLWPTIPMTLREATADTSIGDGISIRKSDQVLLHPYALARLPSSSRNVGLTRPIAYSANQVRWFARSASSVAPVSGARFCRQQREPDANCAKKRHCSRSTRALLDGGSRGNRGPGSAGAVLVTADRDGLDPQVVWSACMSYARADMTNNQAEYLGVITGLNEAQRRGWKIDVVGGSSLILGQLANYRPPRNLAFRPLYSAARRLAYIVPVDVWQHHLRAHNKMDDAAANIAMDTRESFQTSHPSDRPHTSAIEAFLPSDYDGWHTGQLLRAAQDPY